MELHHSNVFEARSLAYHEKTIVLLTDERPEFDRDSAIEIGRFLQENGYFVYECTVHEFMEKNLALLGAMLILPHAQSVPAEIAQALKQYWLQGGQVLALGGPLFCDLIEEDNGVYVKKELPYSVLDAQHSGKTGDIVIEGLVPTYKVYLEQSVTTLMTESQQVTHVNVVLAEPESVVCPVARPAGSGFQMEHRSRFLPLLQVKAETGRADGRRGAAAFLMLNDTRGHLRFTNGSRPGSASATVMGSSIGCIGLRTQKLMDIAGIPQLILDMVHTMLRGLYLYEAGAAKFVYSPKETGILGAKVLNTTQDFVEVKVRFKIKKNGANIFVQEEKVLALPRTYAECSINFDLADEGDYLVETELLVDDVVVDVIHQDICVHVYRPGKQEEFVCVKGRDFILGGKQWNLFGINYWPLYFPGFEREDYWMGWLDKSNYDPLEVERDLQLLEDMGMNCLFTRLDGNILGRSVEQLKDFMLRIERHHMKLSISYPNATNPLYYSPQAFRALEEKACLYQNPTLFGHDLVWEPGHQFFMENYLPLWRDGWVKWIKERYGNIENAEQDWGVLIDRREDGTIVTPPKSQLEFDGPWRIKICAFRRFLDDYLSRIWNDTVSDIRSVDPDHIVGYRMGCFYKDTGPTLTATNKHIDYSSLEGYSFMEDEDGRYASQCVTKVSQMLTGGKPVVWVEYGSNLIGTSGNSAWSALKWQRDTLMPPAYRYEEQKRYFEQFFRMFRACDIAGSAPWWFAGGFRRVECSDCGIVNPDGTLRPVAESYQKLGRTWILPERVHKKPDIVFSYDPDIHSAGWGKFYLGSGPIDRNENSWAEAEGRVVPGEPEYGIGVQMCRKAEEEGKELAFTTPGFGTTSRDTPLEAVGNVPYNGRNPMKYLDGEFNEVLLNIQGGKKFSVRDESCFSDIQGPIDLYVSMGNLREATWLAGSETGDVVLTLYQNDIALAELLLEEDTPYLADGIFKAHEIILQKGNTFTLQLQAKDRCNFGERWQFTIQ